jgi:3-oxoacyl-[acyl-carrier-protein] synthase III
MTNVRGHVEKTEPSNGSRPALARRESAEILGIGAWLPETVRANDWWPRGVVQGWREHYQAQGTERPVPAGPADDASGGRARVAAALAGLATDPFQGSRERRVLADHVAPSDMEARACQRALEKSGLAPSGIDFLLGFSTVPDHLGVPNVCTVHRRLGLPERCLSLTTEASFNAFSVQMELAAALIRSGAHHYGLLYQSSALTRLIPMDAHYAPWFGDGATAVVVGPAMGGSGLLAGEHCTDGSLAEAMVAGIPGRRWYDGGRIWWYPRDRTAAQTLFLDIADRAAGVVGAAMDSAGVASDQVDFYAAHQPTAWFRQVTQEHLGLERARSLDTFPWAGSLGAANVPLVLGTASDEGLLGEGDIIVTHSGGLGVTWSSQVFRWGRAGSRARASSPEWGSLPHTK